MGGTALQHCDKADKKPSIRGTNSGSIPQLEDSPCRGSLLLKPPDTCNGGIIHNHRYLRSSTISSDIQQTTAISNSSKSPNMITADHISDYLSKHPDFLENFVMDKVEVEQLERWIIRKSQRMKKRPELRSGGRKTSLSRWKFCVHADKRQMLQDLTQSLQHKPTKDHVLWELANCICSAVNADGFRLYLSNRSDPDDLSLFLGGDCSGENGEMKIQKIKNGISLPSYVARTQEPLRLSKGTSDPRFQDQLTDEADICHIQCQPIIQADGQLAAVLELWRRENGGPFHEEDEEIASSYLVWGGIALHYAQLYLNMNQQRKLNDFLLAVVKSIFQDMVSMDMLVMKIMNFAQRLVDADRASLFLVDAKNKELYATIFDVGVENTESSDGVYSNFSDHGSESEFKVHTSKEIRFPLGTGIAGQVAMTGEILNIKDAYADSRFNRTVDQLTGYKTRTILCMPIYIRGNIIGVVQMVNKHVGYFTKDDEEAFETFAVYCGLALHHAKLYDKIRKSEQKYKVALEVLSYHNTCTDEEFGTVFQRDIPKEIVGIDDYYFNIFGLDDLEKARNTIYMFSDLFSLNEVDQKCLMLFTLTVRKNYRRVPYHNWTHGFSVANSMYCIIKHARGAFTTNECLALFIGALCHDLDHRGKNNKFMLDTESPLAAIYSTSTMEHHHFNQTVTILQQEGHNIFSKLSNNDYKQVLGLLKHCILATDLAVFFPNKAKLTDLVQTNSFSWNITEHRRLIQAIAMTGSDLCASAKPWDVQVETVKGFNDVGFHGSDEIPTPNIDALAYNGVILNSHYTQALCTPSRASFLTGKYPIHLGMQHLVILEPEPWGVPLNATMMPQHFKNNGYKTHAVGKWHLGFFKKEYTPTYRGFDSHYGYWQGLQDYYQHTVHATFTSEFGYDMRRNMEVDWEAKGKYSTTLFTEEAIKLINEHDTKDPMFLYMAHLAPHTGNDEDPLQAPDEEIAKFAHIEDPERRIYAAMVSMLDKSVGTVITALREKHMLENSIILLFSDNGAQPEGTHANHGSNYPFKGAKNSAWEGGQRNLALVWSPLIKKTQRVANQFMHLSDWLPTLYSAAGLNKSELGNIDGLDLWKAISNDEESPRTELIYNIDDEFNYGAVRQGDWKYTYGSTNKGLADKWFGDSGTKDTYQYDKTAILNSKVNNALAGVITYKQISEKNKKKVKNTDFTINIIDEKLIDRLRDEATVKCQPRERDQLEQYKCNLLETPCLFNIKLDPCETKNLVNERPNIARNLETLLMKYSKTALPPRNVPRDPKADPSNWNGTWTNWQDCENVVRQKLAFNNLTPTAIGLIAAACIAVIVIILTLIILNCRQKTKKSRRSSFIEDDLTNNVKTPLKNVKKDCMFEDRELEIRTKLKEDIRTA